MKPSFDKENGFTLVELIVALAILSIGIFAFSYMFSSSFANVFTAGRKSSSLLSAQEELELQIAVGTATDSEELSVFLPDGTEIKIPGEFATGTYMYENKTGTVTTFIPSY